MSFRTIGIAILPLSLVLAGCEFTDYVLPNPDARTLYTEPYLGLKQLNAVEARLLDDRQVSQLKGQLASDQAQLANYSTRLAPEAASLVLSPPQNADRLDTNDIKVAVLSDSQLADLAKRQRDTDLELGIYREARIRAQEIAERREASEAARAEQLRRVQEANERLSTRELLPPREVEQVPQPETPTSVGELFAGSSEEGEVPIAIVYFASRSAELGAREQVVIGATARQLAGRGWTLMVRGFDSGSLANRTRADRARSLALSRQRADAVRSLLVASGFEAENIKIEALGDQNPTFAEVNDVGVFANQRVVITGIQQEDQ